MGKGRGTRLGVALIAFACAALQVLSSPGSLAAGTRLARYAAGTGTEADPYQIATAVQLNQIGTYPEDWSAHFVLTADLDLSGLTGTQFNRIGRMGESMFAGDTGFLGTFDGQGHVVQSFTWEGDEDEETHSGVGLFGCLGPGGQIRNLHLADASVSVEDGNLVGCLVALNTGGLVVNCSVSGTIAAGGRSGVVGGLVGANLSGAIHNCTSAVTVAAGTPQGESSGTIGGLLGGAEGGELVNCVSSGDVVVYGDGGELESIGGLVGYMGGRILHCAATGAVTVGDKVNAVGGLVGTMYTNTVSDSYCTGTVTTGAACSRVGGFAGAVTAATVLRCYTTGDLVAGVSGENSLGRMVGEAISSSITGSFWSLDSVGPAQGVGSQVDGTVDASGLATAAFAVQATFAAKGWDFSRHWEQQAFPVHRAAADLAVFAPSGLDAQPGQNVPLSLRLLNRGTAAAGAYSVKVFLVSSPDADWEGLTAGAVLVETTVPGHDAQEWVVCDLVAAAPATTGLHYLRARVDPADVVPEWCEDGNWSAVFPLLVGEATYSGGDGTSERPYEISSWNDLQLLGWQEGDWDKHFVLTVDVQAPGRASAPLRSIGYLRSWGEQASFRGSFSGGGHAVIGLAGVNSYVGPWSGSPLGLFGWIGKQGRVADLRLTGVDLTCEPGESIGPTGALAGISEGVIANSGVAGRIAAGPGRKKAGMLVGRNTGELNACAVSGSFVATNGGNSLGGLAGLNDGLTRDCVATCTVDVGIGSEHIGGLIGDNEGTIIGSRAEGDVTVGDGSGYVGGLVGGSYGPVTQSSATGAVRAGQARESIGGLIGWNMGPVAECTASGRVEAAAGSKWVGGLIGGSEEPDVSLCSAFGDVVASGCESVGGFIGWQHLGDIRYCRAAGNVTGGSDVGGFCGGNNSGTTRACYATGSVTGGDGATHVGGFCGQNYLGGIDGCYSTGAVNGGSGSTFVGGFCGDLWYGSISNCFWDTQTSGLATSSGGVGKTTAEMQTESTFTDAGWDFLGEDANGTEGIWYMNGWPALSWVDSVFALTVVGGTGGGLYTTGTEVVVSAADPPAGKAFAGWAVDPQEHAGSLTDPAASSTTFTMPLGSVTLTPTYAYTAPQWAVELSLGGALPAALTFGMRDDATDGSDDGVDVQHSLPAPGQAVLASDDLSLFYSTDLRMPAETGEFLLLVRAAADAPTRIAWDLSSLPEGKFLTLYEVVLEDNPPRQAPVARALVGNTALNLALAESLQIPAGETRSYVIRYGDDLVFDLVLLPGWNLLSLPIDPIPAAVESVFADGTMNIGAVWAWQGQGYVAVTEMQACVGYWVYTAQAAVLLVAGAPANQTTLNLVENWNFCGVEVPCSAPAVGGIPVVPWEWDAALLSYRVVAEMLPGRGYCVCADQDASIPLRGR